MFLFFLFSAALLIYYFYLLFLAFTSCYSYDKLEKKEKGRGSEREGQKE